MKTRGEKGLKVGLALSGGGFRATAFHLGVLKRLQELNVLERVEVISTVSGGSIAGAFWVWWQAIGHPSSPTRDKWDEFERRLVRLMRANLRGRVMIWTAVLPAFVAVVLIGIGCLLLGLQSVKAGWLAIAALAAAASGYTGWTLFSGRLLIHYHDRFLFQGAHLQDVVVARKERQSRLPRLFVIAAALETAQQVMFTEQERGGDVLLEIARGVPVVNIFTGIIDLVRSLRERDRPPGKPGGTLWRSETFARAVAASSAVPGIFPPVAVGSAFESFGAAMRRRFPKLFGGADRGKASASAARYHAVDGGVFDNQGIQALIEQACTGIIVSDAAAPLLPARRFRIQRQIRLLKRSQEIIFSRVRELGYSQLRLLAYVNRLLDELRKAGVSSQKLTALRDPDSPPVTAYCTVELSALKQSDTQLPSRVRELVAAMRTDLDGFSPCELSALMFHGYTTADLAFKEHKAIFSLPDRPVRFEAKLAELNIDWTKLDKGDMARALNHLRVSHVQFATWRHCRRAVGALAIWLSEQQWLVALANRTVEAWRNVSPAWEWVQVATMTIESPDGKREENPIYEWRRRFLLRSLWRWIRETWRRTGGSRRSGG